MFKHLLIIAFIFLSISPGFAQHDIKDYQGNWEGVLPSSNSFNFNISLEELNSNTYNLIISNYKTSLNKKLTSTSNERIQISLDKNTHFHLSYNNAETEITGFITSGIMMSHINLKKNQDNLFTGIWSPFMINNLQSQFIFLSIENNGDGSFAAHPFFGDQRFTGTWAHDFIKSGDFISFRDEKTGFNFEATLYENKIQLQILLSARTIAVTNLFRSEVDLSSLHSECPKNQNIEKPLEQNDGWPSASIQELGIKAPPLNRMIESINKKEQGNIHSVLIAKDGKLVFESYFEGYTTNVPHDQRSASKSIASAMIGIAIDDKILEGVDQHLYDLLPKAYQNTKNDLKAKISIKDLLTMSSGLDAIDFGTDKNSTASENNYQNSNDWLRTVLEASMINEPGTHGYYGSANPFLLGVSLSEKLEQPLEFYMDENIFSPLGITNYTIQTENTSTTPYFGGGMYLTPRDMLKFGQLYLNKGNWEGQQIISKKWVEESFEKHSRLENTNDKDEYGYLWWHKTYTVNDKDINSIEARGAGGQNIVVIPDLNTVVVITAENFGGAKLKISGKIVEEYILPAIVK